MNLGDLTNFVEKPLAAVSNIVNTPNSAGRYRPFYLRNLLDAVQGRNLNDAVKGKVVLITGGSSGIGAAAAKKIAEAGGTVVLVARTLENLENVANDIRAIRGNGGTAHVYPCDLSDMDAIAVMADQVHGDLGGVDILINNAGRSIRRSLELSYDRIHDYQRTMQLNYLGAVQLILKFIPGMRERHFGHIVNVSSVGVQTRAPRFGAYIASKAALDSLCDALQAETVHDNVRFTTVHMALVRTPMISPTTIYDKFPTLTPDQAAGVITDAIVHRPRRASSPFGQFAAVADAVNPAVMDRVVTVPSTCSATRPQPREVNPKPTHQNSTSEARRLCGPPEGSIGDTMSLPKPNNQTTVVITGASSGIGVELARGLAGRGFPLMLVARRRERLDELADQLRQEHCVGVEVLPLDLADTQARAQLADRLRSDAIAGLCNSAGFGTSGRFWELPFARESEEVVLNALALMELTHAALPGMVKRGAGAVLNIASIAGFQPIPYMAVYSATKAFVLTFSEAVQEELHGTGVSVTALCPGPVPTEWAEIASAERFSIPLAQVSPHDVAEAAIAGMLSGKRTVVPGIVPKFVSTSGRFAPRSLLLPAIRIGNRLRGGPSR